VEIVSNLIKTINEAKINDKELVQVIADFLYSIGYSLEDSPEIRSSEEIIIRHAKNPSLGNSLMAQAKLMKEAWSQDVEEKKRREKIES